MTPSWRSGSQKEGTDAKDSNSSHQQDEIIVPTLNFHTLFPFTLTIL